MTFLASPLSRAITGESIGTGGGTDRAVTIGADAAVCGRQSDGAGGAGRDERVVVDPIGGHP